ncbi:MAG: glycosyltransferase family 87 protein [Candidatus Sulfotelmatobacter sp.]
MSASNLRNRSGFAALALCFAMVGAAAMLYYHLGLFMPRVLEVSTAKNLAGGYAFGNDFYPVWLTSREWVHEGRDPYSAQMTREIQKGLFGRQLDPLIPTDPLADYRTFAYPAFTNLLFWPASELPFAVVRVVLVLLLAALTAISVFLWARALSWSVSWPWLATAILLTVFSYPVLEGLYAGQLGLLVGFLLAASLLALQRGRLFLAGILMALTTIKPQMTALAIFYLLLWSLADWGRRSRFCVGLFSTMLALVAAATIVWPHWISSWTQVVLRYHRYARPPLVGEVFAQPLGPSVSGPLSLTMITVLFVVAVVLAWSNRTAAANSMQFWLTISLLLSITTITLLPGQALYDHVILLPGIFLLACRWRNLSSTWIRKALLAVGLGILLWPWIASIALTAMRPLLTHQQFYSNVIFALPLRTAAAFPFVVLGLLVLALRRTPTVDKDIMVELTSAG